MKKVYYCNACGKMSTDRVSATIERGWDASCMLNCVKLHLEPSEIEEALKLPRDEARVKYILSKTQNRIYTKNRS